MSHLYFTEQYMSEMKISDYDYRSHKGKNSISPLGSYYIFTAAELFSLSRLHIHRRYFPSSRHSKHSLLSQPLHPLFCVMTDLWVEHFKSGLIMENCLSLSCSGQQKCRPKTNILYKPRDENTSLHAQRHVKWTKNNKIVELQRNTQP